MITSNSTGVKVNGHIGKWHTIEAGYWHGKKVFLMEHDTFGDEAACIIIDKDGKLVLDDVWNGFDDLDN